MFVWDALTTEHIATKRLPKGSRLASAMAFSSSDHYLAVGDMAEKITVHIFDIKQGGSANPIHDVQIG